MIALMAYIEREVMADNDIKTLYTQDEVKTMMRACLKGVNASIRIVPVVYLDDDGIYQIINNIQEMFSQILRILNAEYNEICEAVEAAEREQENNE